MRAGWDDGSFGGLITRARELDLDVLCEVHDEKELQRALDGGAEIIGVNSRDLKTFQANLNTALDLASRLPNHILRIAESGIDCGPDILELHGSGYQAFLIGETLMRAADPAHRIHHLLQD